MTNEKISSDELPMILKEPEGSEGMDLLEVLTPIIKHKFVIALVMATCVMLAVLYNFYATKIYRATCNIVIEQRPSAVTLKEREANAGERFFTYREMNTVTALLNSRSLSEKLVLRLINMGYFSQDLENIGYFDASEEKKAQIVTMLSESFRNIEIESAKETNVVKISYSSSDKLLARDVVNMAAELLIDMHQEEKNIILSRSLSYLNDQLEDARKKVEEKEALLFEYRRQHNIFQTETDKELVAQQLFDLNSKLNEVRDQIQSFDSQIDQLNQLLTRKDYSKYTPVVPDNAVLEDLRSKLVAARIMYQNLLISYDENHPEVIEARGGIEVLKREFEEELAVARTRMQYQRNVLLVREKFLQDTLNEAEKSAVQSTEKDIDYVIIERDANLARGLYDHLLGAVQEINVNASEMLSNYIYIQETASTPKDPIEPRVGLNLIIGLLAGVLLGFFYAQGVEYLDQTVRRPEDVLKLVKLPVLSIVPVQSSSNGNGQTGIISVTRSPKSLFSEGITSLRTHLGIKMPQEGPITLLITSSAPREGKSLISSNLALSMSVEGKKTLLIDADLHRPSIHKIFDLERVKGLSDLIVGALNPPLHELDLDRLSFGDIQHLIRMKQWSGVLIMTFGVSSGILSITYQKGIPIKSDIDEFLQNHGQRVSELSVQGLTFEIEESEILEFTSPEDSGVRAINFIKRFPKIWKSVYFRNLLEREYIRKLESESLHVLTAGTTPSNPSELLGSDQMRMLLDILHEQYERIIIDCPPSWPLSDVTVLSPHADGILWICRAGETPKNMLSHAVKRIQEIQPKVLGVVLNAVDLHRDWRYYYGYSSSYYRNYKYRYYREYLEDQSSKDS